METVLPRLWGSCRHRFLNFLRGMETNPSTGRRFPQGHFLNFLRGMETLGCRGHEEVELPS